MSIQGTFKFKGGQREHSNNRIRATYKFYCFGVWTGAGDKEEVIFHSALKRGIFEKMSPGVYGSNASVLKIFTASKGFGVPSAYQSFFFKLNDLANRRITIAPFGSEVGVGTEALEQSGQHFFQARGSFLAYNEIVDLFGAESQTVSFYDRQTMIPKTEMQKLIKVDYVEEDGSPTQVRMLRL